MVFPFLFSFFGKNIDTDFTVAEGEFTQKQIFLNGQSENISQTGGEFSNGCLHINDTAEIVFENGKCDFFNYYAISYSSDSYVKGAVKYVEGGAEKSEEFFLSQSDEKSVFYSFTDNFLNKKKANKILSLSFEPLSSEEAELKIYGVATFNRKIEDTVVYSENEYLKIGINLQWGGALSYLEDLDSDVEAVKKDGEIFVDSNASERYCAKAVNKSVNLINCYDAGRLVQQSFYGTWDSGYEGGEFMGEKWNYNPVQGGNLYNESSKIVDLKCSNGTVYVKCRPLDWSKEKEFITPSYMESVYSLDGKNLNISCSFTDFSGYPATYTTQEMPAFYCIEPLNYFYYCDSGEVKCRDDLIFWPDAGYPNFPSNENWVAFAGEFDDSFGIGLYVPNGTSFLAGIYNHGKTKNTNPSEDEATSYVALVRWMEFKSFSPINYTYTITTGTVDEIRNRFNGLSK